MMNKSIPKEEYTKNIVVPEMTAIDEYINLYGKKDKLSLKQLKQNG